MRTIGVFLNGTKLREHGVTFNLSALQGECMYTAHFSILRDFLGVVNE